MFELEVNGELETKKIFLKRKFKKHFTVHVRYMACTKSHNPQNFIFYGRGGEALKPNTYRIVIYHASHNISYETHKSSLNRL